MVKLSAIAPLKGLLIARPSLKYLATAQRVPLRSLASFLDFSSQNLIVAPIKPILSS